MREDEPSAVQLLRIGIIGAYAGRIFVATTRRPLFVIRAEGSNPAERDDP